MSVQQRFSRIDPALAERLYRDAKAERWRLAAGGLHSGARDELRQSVCGRRARRARDRALSGFTASRGSRAGLRMCAGRQRSLGSLRARDAPGAVPRGRRARSIWRRARAGRLALRDLYGRRPARRNPPVASALLSRPQQSRDLAPRRPRTTSCRSHARRPRTEPLPEELPARTAAAAARSGLRAFCRDAPHADCRSRWRGWNRAIVCASAATTRSS